MANLEQLLLETAGHGRVCPKPAPWNTLWELLPDRQRAADGWQPPLPLILAAWEHSSDHEKRERFELHLRWANDHDSLDDVATYLNTLEPDDWHTAPTHG